MCIAREESLVREALVREIRDADRWSAVSEAWYALLSVRRMADQMKKECAHLGCSTPNSCEYSVQSVQQKPCTISPTS